MQVSFTFDVAFQDLQDFLLSLNNILKLLRCGEFSESLVTILSLLLYMAPSGFFLNVKINYHICIQIDSQK